MHTKFDFQKVLFIKMRMEALVTAPFGQFEERAGLNYLAIVAKGTAVEVTILRINKFHNKRRF